MINLIQRRRQSNPRNKISKMCFQIWWICSHSAIFNLSDLQVTRQYFFFLLYCMFHSASCIAIDVRFCLQYIEASLKKTNCSIVLDFWWLLLLEWLLGYFWTILFSQKSCFRKSLIILHEFSGSRICVLCLSCPYSLSSLLFFYIMNLLLNLLFIFIGMS